MIFGTRPEAIKLAPVIGALNRSDLFETIPVVTAQHREMLDQVLGFFDIEPRFDLDILAEGQSLTDVAVRSLGGLSSVLETERPDVAVVQGDTTSTLMGALAAFYHGVPVAHVEAGLRTGDPRVPFPEELNRRLTSQLATLHLAPTRTNRANLLREGVDAKQIVVTGNTVIDALLWAVQNAESYGDPALADLDDDPRRVLLVTAHRRESWGTGMASIAEALADLARGRPDLLVVFPIHRNPVVREAILPAIGALPNVIVTEPLGYGGFARLMQRSHLILTDSGGIQEEAPALGKPVLVMRDATERPEALAAGGVKLVGTSRATIVEAVHSLLENEAAYRSMAQRTNPYGDGRAAERTVGALAALFGAGASPGEFSG